MVVPIMGNSHKTRKFSIRTKIVALAGILMIALSAMLSWLLYSSVEEVAISLAGDMGLSVATVVRDSLDKARAKKLLAGNDAAAYEAAHKHLGEIKEKCKAAYIYLLKMDGGKAVFVANSGTEAYGDDFGETAEYFNDVMSGTSRAEDYIDEEEGNHIVTCYVPFKDENGKVIAVLGVDADANNAYAAQMENFRKALMWSGISLVAALVLLSIVAAAITRNLWVVNDKIYDIVSNNGDLTKKLDVESGDETENIANNVNELIEYIKAIMLHIDSDSESLSTSAKQVSDNLFAAQNEIREVSGTMETLSAGMEETTAMVNQVNSDVHGAEQAVASVAEEAKEGQRLTEEIKQRAAAIYKEAHETKQAAADESQRCVALLNEKIQRSRSVEQINTLTDDILKIASQTRLLALNASIEAARAGEAGRGFSVVAENISKLADESTKSAAQIQEVSADVINAVSELSEEATRAIDYMNTAVSEGYDKLIQTAQDYDRDADHLAESMGRFAETSGDVGERMNSIKEAMEGINVASDEGARDVTNVAATAQQLSLRYADIGAEAEETQQISEKLDSEVKKFKLR